MFFRNKEIFLEVLEKNIDRIEYFNNGIDSPTMVLDICVDCDSPMTYIDKGAFIEVCVDSIHTKIVNREISTIFKNLYEKNIKKVLYNYIHAVVDTEPTEDIYYKPILLDFYYDILDLLENNKPSSVFLEFNNYTIFVDNIDGVNFYKL